MKAAAIGLLLVTGVLSASSLAGPVKGAAKDRLVDEAKEGISRDLKDPSSAQFRNIWIAYEAEIDKSTVCGEVNAKNSYGAYVGFSPFAYRVESLKGIKNGADDYQSTIVDLFCAEKFRAQ